MEFSAFNQFSIGKHCSIFVQFVFILSNVRPGHLAGGRGGAIATKGGTRVIGPHISDPNDDSGSLSVILVVILPVAQMFAVLAFIVLIRLCYRKYCLKLPNGGRVTHTKTPVPTINNFYVPQQQSQQTNKFESPPLLTKSVAMDNQAKRSSTSMPGPNGFAIGGCIGQQQAPPCSNVKHCQPYQNSSARYCGSTSHHGTMVPTNSNHHGHYRHCPELARNNSHLSGSLLDPSHRRHSHHPVPSMLCHHRISIGGGDNLSDSLNGSDISINNEEVNELNGLDEEHSHQSHHSQQHCLQHSVRPNSTSSISSLPPKCLHTY